MKPNKKAEKTISNRVYLVIIVLIALIALFVMATQFQALYSPKTASLLNNKDLVRNNAVQTALFSGSNTAITRQKVIMFKDPECDCCVSYASYLRSEGFDVEIRTTEDMRLIKSKYHIPTNMESCHTSIIGDYFVEGHVLIEAINKLLQEKPAIDGIALPQMPAGSPGMDGAKSGPFKIYSLTNGTISDFMTI